MGRRAPVARDSWDWDCSYSAPTPPSPGAAAPSGSAPLGGGAREGTSLISSADSNCANKSCKSWNGRDPLATQVVKRTGRDGYHTA